MFPQTPSMVNSVGGTSGIPSVEDIQKTTEKVFGRRPCLWQCRVALALLRGDKDVVCISGTGSGKTLCFWIPLLFRPVGIQVIITPLNLLGDQNRQQLEKVGIKALTISGETASYHHFQVRLIYLRQRINTHGNVIRLLRTCVMERWWSVLSRRSRLTAAL